LIVELPLSGSLLKGRKTKPDCTMSMPVDCMCGVYKTANETSFETADLTTNKTTDTPHETDETDETDDNTPRKTADDTPRNTND
jgi:hypothetical protein